MARAPGLSPARACGGSSGVKTLVTGGAGFIGSHLFSTGRPDTLSHLAGHARVRLERVDVTEPDRLGPLFEGADWVFHLAALADIVPSIERPLDYHDDWRAAPVWTPESIEVATRDWFRYLGKG